MSEVLSIFNSGTPKFDKTFAATTVANEWFPCYISFAQFLGSVTRTKVYEHLFDNEYLYYKPANAAREPYNYFHVTDYNSLIDQLQNGMSEKCFKVRSDGNEEFLTVVRGYLADKFGKVLLLLTTDSYSGLIKNPQDRRGREIDESHLKLFVSVDLINDEKYKLIYKQLQKKYIQLFHEAQIPVEFTTTEKIQSTCFSSGFELKFDSLQELDNHLVNEVPDIYNQTLDHFFTFGGDQNLAEAVTDDSPGMSTIDLETVSIEQTANSHYIASVDPANSERLHFFTPTYDREYRPSISDEQIQRTMDMMRTAREGRPPNIFPEEPLRDRMNQMQEQIQNHIDEVVSDMMDTSVEDSDVEFEEE